MPEYYILNEGQYVGGPPHTEHVFGPGELISKEDFERAPFLWDKILRNRRARALDPANEAEATAAKARRMENARLSFGIAEGATEAEIEETWTRRRKEIESRTGQSAADALLDAEARAQASVLPADQARRDVTVTTGEANRGETAAARDVASDSETRRGGRR